MKYRVSTMPCPSCGYESQHSELVDGLKRCRNPVGGFTLSICPECAAPSKLFRKDGRREPISETELKADPRYPAARDHAMKILAKMYG